MQDIANTRAKIKELNDYVNFVVKFDKLSNNLFNRLDQFHVSINNEEMRVQSITSNLMLLKNRQMEQSLNVVKNELNQELTLEPLPATQHAYPNRMLSLIAPIQHNQNNNTYLTSMATKNSQRLFHVEQQFSRLISALGVPVTITEMGFWNGNYDNLRQLVEEHRVLQNNYNDLDDEIGYLFDQIECFPGKVDQETERYQVDDMSDILTNVEQTADIVHAIDTDIGLIFDRLKRLEQRPNNAASNNTDHNGNRLATSKKVNAIDRAIRRYIGMPFYKYGQRINADHSFFMNNLVRDLTIHPTVQSFLKHLDEVLNNLSKVSKRTNNANKQLPLIEDSKEKLDVEHEISELSRKNDITEHEISELWNRTDKHHVEIDELYTSLEQARKRANEFIRTAEENEHSIQELKTKHTEIADLINEIHKEFDWYFKDYYDLPVKEGEEPMPLRKKFDEIWSAIEEMRRGPNIATTDFSQFEEQIQQGIQTRFEEMQALVDSQIEEKIKQVIAQRESGQE